ncbi:hypothetical protein [Rhizobium leguminosarum]|uniref:hypothetical protein n=1 Tax=Rhizobium leguminosarum TaxID=384 RepID=UPI003F9C031D
MRLGITIALAVSVPTLASAQAFDWSAQLGTSPSAFEAALGSSSKCTRGGFSVPVRFVDETTTLAPDLFDPVKNTSDTQYAPILTDPDLTVDEKDDRRYVTDLVSTIHCSIGREASASAYIFNDRIVRISLTFDRCKTREERKNTFIGTVANPFVYLACDGVDMAEKDFDTSQYQSIKFRNTYGYTKQGKPGMMDFEWAKTMRGDYEAAERELIFDFGCSGRNEFDSQVSRRSDDEAFRCLIDVDNADPARWSATAMYEIFRPGLISNDVTTRLTARRLFVDMPAERVAAQAMFPGLQVMIDGIKAQINDRVGKKVSEDDAVSKVLGAGN